MIRNAAIAALLLAVGFTAYSGASDAISSVQAASAKFMSRTAAVGAALDYPQ